MSETQTIDQIKSRLEQFITDIDQVNPNQVRVEDIDEWIGLLDQLEEKVKSVSHPVDEQKISLTQNQTSQTIISN